SHRLPTLSLAAAFAKSRPRSRDEWPAARCRWSRGAPIGHPRHVSVELLARSDGPGGSMDHRSIRASPVRGDASPRRALPPGRPRRREDRTVARSGQTTGWAGRPMRGEFLIDGELSGNVLSSCPELRRARGPAGGSVLYGPVVDRAHL